MVSAIIVAAGKGIRMNYSVRKQYLLLAGRPVLGHTLEIFIRCDEIEEIILVVPEEDFDFCKRKILLPLKPHKRVNLVSGGQERQESVYNGLMAAGDKESVVVIHDGVRPFVYSEQVSECIKGAKEFGACIVGIPVYETLKHVNHSGYTDKTIERDAIWLAQTPQAFQYSLIKKAHETARQKGYTCTDDAQLVERMGKEVKIISGSRYNIKITNREDLELARAILRARVE